MYLWAGGTKPEFESKWDNAKIEEHIAGRRSEGEKNAK